jgi:hypothetical protein
MYVFFIFVCEKGHTFTHKETEETFLVAVISLIQAIHSCVDVRVENLIFFMQFIILYLFYLFASLC